MSSSLKKYFQGFTVIEMVVVMAIIAITSSIVIVSITAERATREAERNAHVLTSNLRQMQNYALSGRSDTTTQENCFYGIRFISSSQYSLVNYYRSGGTCNSYNTIATVNLVAGVTFTGIGSYPTIFAFSLPRAEVYTGTSGALSLLGATQLIGLTKAGKNSYLCLYSVGRIEERGTDNTCP